MDVTKIKTKMTYNCCVNGSWAQTPLKQKIVTTALFIVASLLDLSIVSRPPLRMGKYMI